MMIVLAIYLMSYWGYFKSRQDLIHDKQGFMYMFFLWIMIRLYLLSDNNQPLYCTINYQAGPCKIKDIIQLTAVIGSLVCYAAIFIIEFYLKEPLFDTVFFRA